MPERLLELSWWRSHANDVVVLIGVIIILAATLAGVLKVYQTAAQAHDAVCALRAERIRGIQSTRRFLEEHPHGISGISRADLLRSIETQKQTVRAFRFADC